MHCKQFKYRLYNVSVQRAHGAPTTQPRRFKRLQVALPQRPHSALSNTLCKRQAAAFVLSMFKINNAAWRLHSVFTALLATAQPAPRRSSTFLTPWKCCEDAALVWQGITELFVSTKHCNIITYLLITVYLSTRNRSKHARRILFWATCIRDCKCFVF